MRPAESVGLIAGIGNELPGTQTLAALSSDIDPLLSLDWGTRLSGDVIDVYFAPYGTYIDGVTDFGSAQGFTSFEIDQMMLALTSFSDVTGLSFQRTWTQSDAEFRVGAFDLSSFDAVAFMVPPGESFSGFMGVDPYYLDWYDVDTGNPLTLEGGFMFAVLLEEFGHGLGLAHPHDDGGTSTILDGVVAPRGSYGVGDLNQGIFTIMGYNEGWPGGPEGLSYYDGTYLYLNDFGYETGPGALDIAILQAKYGANDSHAGGDDVYLLPEANGPGTFFRCVWDTGGTDEFRFSGSADATIDLRPATLAADAGGGGYVSWAEEVRGGFTIAAGVEIENATGGEGDDTLIGNQLPNTLNGGAGADFLVGDWDDLLLSDGWIFDFGPA